MFKKLFWICSLTFLVCFVLVVGYTTGRAMWFECSTWYGQLLTVLAVLTFEFGCLTALENLWKTF